jgi:hypothetical protein
MHRAEQVIDALVALQPVSDGQRFKNRTLSLSADDLELPAAVVSIGEDSPLDDDGASNLAFLDSLLTADCELVVQASNEEDAASDLMDLRRDQHVAIMADRSLGLSFVIDTRYQGASAPEFEQLAEFTAARMTTRWLVHYRMNIADPA